MLIDSVKPDAFRGLQGGKPPRKRRGPVRRRARG